MTANQREELIFGLKRSVPIMIGYFPVGMAFGVLAADIGLTPFEAGLMSLFVYAGSSQFIAVKMLGISGDIMTIIITTFLVNLRHLLFSASLSPYFKEIKQKLIPVISFGITDETFAVSITDVREKSLSHFYFFGIYFTSYLAWIASTVLGSVLGSLIPDTKALGFDFALPGMFLGLLCIQIKNFKNLVVALLAGLLSILFMVLIPGNWNVILATMIAAFLGVTIEKCV